MFSGIASRLLKCWYFNKEEVDVLGKHVMFRGHYGNSQMYEDILSTAQCTCIITNKYGYMNTLYTYVIGFSSLQSKVNKDNQNTVISNHVNNAKVIHQFIKQTSHMTKTIDTIQIIAFYKRTLTQLVNDSLD